jgi:hypothetical protein
LETPSLQQALQSNSISSPSISAVCCCLADINLSAATDNNPIVIADIAQASLAAQNYNSNQDQDQQQSVSDSCSKFNDETSNSSLVKKDLSVATSSLSADSLRVNNAEHKRNHVIQPSCSLVLQRRTKALVMVTISQHFISLTPIGR